MPAAGSPDCWLDRDSVPRGHEVRFRARTASEEPSLGQVDWDQSWVVGRSRQYTRLSTGGCARRAALELPPQRELDNPRVGRTDNLAEGAVAEGCVYEIKVRVVEDIEELAAKLNGVVLGDTKVLVEPHVEIHQAGSANDAVSGIAEESESRAVEGALIEPLAGRFRPPQRGARQAVRPDGQALIVHAEHGIERESALDGGCAGVLPTGQRGVLPACRVIEKWQRPDVAKGKQLGHVEIRIAVIGARVINVLGRVIVFEKLRSSGVGEGVRPGIGCRHEKPLADRVAQAEKQGVPGEVRVAHVGGDISPSLVRSNRVFERAGIDARVVIEAWDGQRLIAVILGWNVPADIARPAHR